MADSEERKRIMDELYRRQQIQELKGELQRRGIDPNMNAAVNRAAGMRSQSGPPQIPGQAPAPVGEDPIVKRGDILPLGRTQSGKIVPAIPAPFVEGGEVTKRMMEGGPQPTGGETFRLGAVGLPFAGSRIPNMRYATSEELGAIKRQLYNATDKAGVGYTPQAASRFVGDLSADLASDKAGFLPKLQPQGAAVLEELQKQVGGGQPISLTKLDTLRKLARGIYTKKPNDENEQRIAKIIIDRIDKFIDEAGPSDVTGGDPKTAAGTIKMARQFALRERKGEILDDMFERADLNKGDLKQSGFENALRREFKKLANPDNPDLGKFTAEEQAAIKDAAKTGEGFQKFLIGWANAFSPTAGALGKTTAAVAAGGAYETSPLLLLLPASGYAAKALATKMRLNAVGRVEDLVRGGAGAGNVQLRQAMRERNQAIGLTKGLAIGGPSALMPEEFNPLTNPNQL